MFSGNRADYLISYNAATQTFTVTDQRGGSPEGTDTVTGVENFQFADGVLASSTIATPAVNHAPVVTIPPGNVSASAGQVIAASGLFSISDADNDPLTYFLYDCTPNGGHFVVNDVAVADLTVVALSASQLAQTTFVAGAAGSSDDLAAMAYDGHTYSGNTSFTQLHVNVASASPASPNAPTGGNDNFVFKPGLGQKALMDFRQRAADNDAVHADLPADHLKQMFGAGFFASTDTTSDAGVHREAVVDLLGLFGQHAADHAHFIF